MGISIGNPNRSSPVERSAFRAARCLPWSDGAPVDFNKSPPQMNLNNLNAN